MKLTMQKIMKLRIHEPKFFQSEKGVLFELQTKSLKLQREQL